MAVVSMKELLECGVHFGHQTRRWNPKMKKYIFTERNGIYILDLQKTLKQIEEAYKVIRTASEAGQSVLFVGTKQQAKDVVKREAERCEMYHVTERWLGGMLTNYQTIRQSVRRLESLDKMSKDSTYERLTKKEVIRLERERGKLQQSLGGIRDMGKLPGLVFVVDVKKERIAVAEAHHAYESVDRSLASLCGPDVRRNHHVLRPRHVATGSQINNKTNLIYFLIYAFPRDVSY